MQSCLALCFSTLVVIFAQDCPKHLRRDISLESEIITHSKWNLRKGYYKGYKKSQNQFPVYQIQSQGPIQQQQQQQLINNDFQSNANFVPNVDILTTPEPTEEPEPKTLWKIQLPKNFKEVTILHLGNPAAEPVHLTGDVMKNVSQHYSDSDAQLDITDMMEVTVGEWYLICGKQGMIMEGKLSSCYQCNILRPDRSSSYVITAKLYETLPTTVKMMYTVSDYPLSTSKILTKAMPVDEYERCHDKISPAKAVESPILPHMVTDVTIGPLEPSQTYVITSELLFNGQGFLKKMGIPEDVSVSSNVISNRALEVPRACSEKGSRSFSFSG